MWTIGEFASIGRVSVRMLRHYDQIGLLRPARVDAITGYRTYAATQLTLLSRIVELKGLGLTLEQVSRAWSGATWMTVRSSGCWKRLVPNCGPRSRMPKRGCDASTRASSD